MITPEALTPVIMYIFLPIFRKARPSIGLPSSGSCIQRVVQFSFSPLLPIQLMLKLKEKGLPKSVHVIVRDRKYGEGAQVNAPLANRRREDTGDYWGLQ